MRILKKKKDVNHLYRAMDDLFSQKQFLDEIFNCSNVVIMIWDLKGYILEVNYYFCELLGFKESEIIGQKWYESIIPKEERINVINVIKELQNHNRVHNFEKKVLTKDERILEIIWNHTVIQSPKSKELLVISFGVDISTEKEQERKIYELAYRDRLTGFKNRAALEKEMGKRIERKAAFTLYYIDIDDFKNLNDIHGHSYGNLFLKYYANHLQSYFKEIEIYHMGGDEFFALEEELGEEVMERRIKEILALSKERWCYDSVEYYPSASIGISQYPYDGETVEEIHKNIDMALNHSKVSGKRIGTKYHSNLQKKIESRVIIENAIYDALMHDGFELYFQPIFRLETGSIYGIEALLRWKSKEEEIGIEELISVAEKTGQILRIDRWVIENAFKFIAKELGNSDIVTSINLSAKTVTSPELVTFLKKCLTLYKVNPKKIIFELTEHSLVNDMNESRNLMNALKALGFKIAIDDFGTRYSSLNYLTHMPFDSLKIDKSYIDEITENRNSRVIVEQIIQLAKRLGMKVVSEGIETIQQYQVLAQCGCDFGQGYLISKPLNKESLKAFQKEYEGLNKEIIQCRSV